jgi:alginate O-acetyltransferase complex protein AlgJ
MRRTADRLIVALFILIITLPLAATIAGVEGADAAAERRELAKYPAFDGTVRSLTAFPAELGRWFDDHFAFRAALIRWDARFRLFVLKASASTAVMPAKDGWLFYADDGAVEDMADEPLMAAGDIANWRETITRSRDWLRARGIAFVFAIVPDKHVIYADKLPDTVHRTGVISRTDQVLSAISDLGVAIDLRPALFAAKQRDRVYHLTDTHWNERGVYVGYHQIISALHRQQPAVPPPWPRSDFQEKSRVVDAGDLGGMLGLTRVLQEERLLLVPRRPRHAKVVEPPGATPTDEEGLLITEIPGSRLPRAVIFRDSFVSPVVPFLSEHFSRAVYFWQKDFVPEQVLAEHPDVVIYEIAGRHLYNFIPSPELIKKN